MSFPPLPWCFFFLFSSFNLRYSGSNTVLELGFFTLSIRYSTFALEMNCIRLRWAYDFCDVHSGGRLMEGPLSVFWQVWQWVWTVIGRDDQIELNEGEHRFMIDDGCDMTWWRGLVPFPCCTYFEKCFAALLLPPPLPVVNLLTLLLARDLPWTRPRISLTI